MVALTLTNPLAATDGGWFHRFATRHFEGTAFILAGIRHVGIPLFLVLVFSAAVLAALASAAPERSRRDAGLAVLALSGWIFLASTTPHLIATQRTWATLGLVAATVSVVVLVPRLVAVAWRLRRPAFGGH